jgi:predicted negative regulator of RcsB-dependent stress response
VARITRKELKTDRFAVEVGHTVEYVEEHKQQVVRYTAIGLAIAVVGVGTYFYRKHQHAASQQVLAQAIQVQEAPVGAAPPNTPVSFPTQPAKDAAAVKAFTKIASDYPRSDEALIARYYLGSIAADQGKLAEAEKHFKAVADSSDAKYASLAKLALAQIYFIDGHAEQGEKLLRALIDRPTVFVSKEQATIALARGLAKTKPAEARKLLEPLRTQRSAISQVAITALSELPGQ